MTPAAALADRSVPLALADGTGPKEVHLLLGVALDDTGVGLLRGLLTGIAAVASGLFLAGLGRRRTKVRRS